MYYILLYFVGEKLKRKSTFKRLDFILKDTHWQPVNTYMGIAVNFQHTGVTGDSKGLAVPFSLRAASFLLSLVRQKGT